METEREMITRALAVRAGEEVTGLTLSRGVVRALGIGLTDIPAEALVARVWEGEAWGPQTFVGMLVTGALPGGLGVGGVTGGAVRAQHTSAGDVVWSNRALADVLRTSRFRGPVFVLMTAAGNPVDVTPYPPGGVLFAMLEGCRVPVGRWYEGPTPLLESWTVSLAVSAWPWPLDPDGTVVVPALPDRVRKHFWSPWGALADDTVAQGRLLGWATAWSETLSDAVTRATVTARAIPVDGLQYRPGAGRDLVEVLARVKNAGVIIPS